MTNAGQPSRTSARETGSTILGSADSSFLAEKDPSRACVVRLSPEDYLRGLRSSRLVSADALEALVQRFASRPDLAMTLPEFVLASGVVTPWQHAMLSRGCRQGFHLDRWTLLDMLGSGAMNEVFLAQDSHGNRVAIKILKASMVAKSSLGERLRLEGKLLEQFRHPHLIRCLHVGEYHGRCFLVMEYLDGCDLSSWVDRRGLPDFKQAAEFIYQASQGLEYLHQHGIVHRDIKPANLFVDQQGVVKIVDLGLARAPDGPGVLSLTAMHRETLLGTPDYMAPEQVLECHYVDGRADLYSLGGTLYFLLTGHAPFNEGSLASRLLKHQHEAPESIYFHRPDAPTALVDLCRRLLAKRPDDRLGTAGELCRLLGAWLGTSPSSAVGETPARADARDDFSRLLRWSQRS